MTLVEISLSVLFFTSGPEIIRSYQIVLWPHLETHLFLLGIIAEGDENVCKHLHKHILSSENLISSHRDRSRSGMEQHLETVTGLLILSVGSY